MITVNDKNKERIVRHKRVRNKISGTKKCPRLNVYRSLNNIYAQIIDDERGVTLTACSTLDKEVAEKIKGKTKSEQAFVVGQVIGERAKALKIKEVVFDRGGFIYQGKIQALADAAREAGLEF